MALTVTQLIQRLKDRTLRDSTFDEQIIVDGINFVKNDLVIGKQYQSLWVSADDSDQITLVVNQVEYDLPADFGTPDKFVVKITEDNRYELKPGSRTYLNNERTTSSYPDKYCIVGDKVLIGPKPGQSLTVVPEYWKTVSDYTVTSTDVPIFASKYGDNVYIYGTEAYLFARLKNAEGYAMSAGLYEREKTKIDTAEYMMDQPFVSTQHYRIY